MFQVSRVRAAAMALVAGVVLVVGGCTGPLEYVRNGFKVGPNYCPAPAPVAAHWIDVADAQLRSESPDLSHWWCVFNDATLNRLIAVAGQQNLTLRQAAFRILQARAQLAIARGEFFPQSQTVNGSYTRIAAPGGAGAGPIYSSLWSLGFNLQWELDFWGQLRRAITAADANLDANVAAYDQAMVTMLADIAQNYVQIRTDQERIALLRYSVEIQQGVFNYIDARFRAGYRVSNLDYSQALANLRQTQAQILPLEIDLRENSNSLCTLLGIPAMDLQGLLGDSSIPTAPPDVAVGIPAELVRRRPDVRQAERLAAAQAEQIGIAEAEFYPIFSVNGTLDWQASTFAGLFSGKSFTGAVGPQFQWNILNYGRIRGNMIYQDALFKQLVVAYQAQVLQTSQDAENGIVTFLKAQVETRLWRESVMAGREAVKTAVKQYMAGAADFNRFATIVQALIPQQDSWAQAQGQIAQGLIQTYRGLGGGWETRGACMPPCPDPYCCQQEIPLPTSPPPERTPESIPTPPFPTPQTAPRQTPESIPAPVPPTVNERPALPRELAPAAPKP